MQNKNESYVAFFEKNGLQHYDFLLEKGKSTVTSVQWNLDGDVLAVSFTPASDANLRLVQLWHRGNFHWYMKQEMRFTDANEPTCIFWDMQQSLRLHIACKDGTYWCNDYCWDTCITIGGGSSNPCVSVVTNASMFFCMVYLSNLQKNYNLHPSSMLLCLPQ